jgi:hypothetical protein
MAPALSASNITARRIRSRRPCNHCHDCRDLRDRYERGLLRGARPEWVEPKVNADI